MKKTILVLLGIFICNFLSAQAPLDKKGAWGVNFGLNYYYPTVNGYEFFPGDNINKFITHYYIKPTGNIGKYLELLKIIRLNKVENKNSFNVLIGLSYIKKNASLKYSKFINGAFEKEGEEKYKKKFPSLDIKLSNIVNFEKKYGVFSAIGFRTDLIRYINNRFYPKYYLTYSLGFLIYLKNINIIPTIDYTIIDLKKDNIYYEPLSTIDDYFKLLNFGVSIFFNNPFNKKENEKK